MVEEIDVIGTLMACFEIGFEGGPLVAEHDAQEVDWGQGYRIIEVGGKRYRISAEEIRE